MNAIMFTVAVIAMLLLIAQMTVQMIAQFYRPDSRVRRRVVVNLDDGKAFAGVLWEKHQDWLVLRNAEFLPEHTAADGELILERARVSFMQAF
jgi:hypothetical protein